VQEAPYLEQLFGKLCAGSREKAGPKERPGPEMGLGASARDWDPSQGDGAVDLKQWLGMLAGGFAMLVVAFALNSPKNVYARASADPPAVSYTI